MSKSKTAFFGLGSTGSIGNALSFARRRGITIAEKKPVPIDRQSLSQMYQRWLYEDYVDLWHQQTPAQKAEYATLGGKSHLTAYQYFMSYQLTYLADIAGWWKLDETSNGLTLDSSRNHNDAVVVGASSATGVIDGCLRFDGVNDYMIIPHSPSLGTPDAFSLCLFIEPHDYPPPITQSILRKRTAGNKWYLRYNVNKTLTFWLWSSAGLTTVTCPILSGTGIFDFIGLRWDGVNLYMYLNSAMVATNPLGGTQDTANNYITIATIGVPPANVFDGRIDNLIYYNRDIGELTMLKWSERRYYL